MEDGRGPAQCGNRTADRTIVIVTPSRLYREALARALHSRELTVVASAAKEALAHVRDLAPNTVLIDHPVHEAHGLIRSLKHVRPAIKIIALSVPETEHAIVEWAHAGASACVTLDTAFEELPSLIDEVARGNLVGTPRVAGLLFRHLQGIGLGTTADKPGQRLTDRELKVLHLVAQGLSNKEIARALSIRLPTVKNHLHSVFSKLGVRRRSEAARWLNVGETPSKY